MDINNYPSIIFNDVLKKYIINTENCDNNIFNNLFVSNSINPKDNLFFEDNIYNDETNIQIKNYYENYFQMINNDSTNKHLTENKHILENENISEKKNISEKENMSEQENISEKENILKQENILEKENILEQENIDPWDLSINDDKFYINNKVARIFPVLKNFNNFSKIKIDDESFCYITIREIADMTSKIICYHLLQYNLNPQKIKIVDYTSGVGGNVLSFSKYFKYVYAVEICKKRAEYLENNVDIYGFKNIQVINKCAIEFSLNDLIKTNPSVVFMDPPWGGSNYKSNENLLLKLGSMNIEELIIDITKKFSNLYDELVILNPKEKTNNYNNKFIVLKLPKNYDIEYLYKYLKNNNNINNYNISSFLYILNKMLIVVCELKFIYT